MAGLETGHKCGASALLACGLFKRVELVTSAPELKFERMLYSSSTSGDGSSQIQLDRKSSQLQSRSSLAILSDFVGTQKRPLLILDSAKSLRQRGRISARIAAAMSLHPLSSEIHFLLEDAEDPESVNWDLLRKCLEENDALLIYGFTWMLWLALGSAKKPASVQNALKGKRIHFVHSGGWKKLEEIRVDRKQFDSALLESLAPDSAVVDYYGLVEQVGIIYPLCEFGFRHVPVWADIIIRNPVTLEPIFDKPGQIQLLNVISFGAPYHSVLTEDVGRIEPGDCPCGRLGKRFELIGRLPKSEIRGCANV